MVDGDRLEIDHPDSLAVRDGVALFAAPGGVPVVFDHESVTAFVGDPAETADRSARVSDPAETADRRSPMPL
jgi:hypothetical protein